MTIISRDRIQFEGLDSDINDGNGQMHRDAAARAWEAAASDYLESHGGGTASVKLGKDHLRFAVSGDKALADQADEAGWDAARAYIAEQVAAASLML